MSDVHAILSNIKATNSSKEKEAILAANKGNQTLARVCSLAYDDTLFFIKKIPAANFGGTPAAPMALDRALDSLVEKIASRNLTGNNALEHLLYLLSSLSPEDADVLAKVVKKDLDSGFSTSTINKVWKDLIAETPYMRCSKSEEKNLAKIKYPAIIQTKADGMFFYIIVADGDVTFKSRNGSTTGLYGLFGDVFRALAEPFGGSAVFQGEGLMRNPDGSTMDRKTGNGLFNKALKGTLSHKEAENAFFKVWDVITIAEYNKRRSDTKAITRYQQLQAAIDTLPGTNEVQLIDSRLVLNREEADAFYKEQRAKGEEGAIIKNTDGVWFDGTSKDCVKMKACEDADLLIIGTEPHSKDPNLIGSLICQTSCGRLITSVGSGLDAEDRAKKPEYFIGKIAAVVYNELITSKSKDTYSMFLPRLEEVREDKTTADSLDKLLGKN